MDRKPVALITGASRGIGACIARTLSEDYSLILVGRDEQALQEVANSCPDACIRVTDLTDCEEIQALADSVPQLDALINNAGAEYFGKIADTRRSQWEKLFDLNVYAVAELCQLLMPKLRESQGDIVMINSGAGKFSGPEMGVYAGSKHALHALTIALREEERGLVRVSAIHPGRVDTDMQRRMQQGKEYHPGDHVAPESVARAVHFVLTATPECTIEELHIRPQVKNVHS